MVQRAGVAGEDGRLRPPAAGGGEPPFDGVEKILTPRVSWSEDGSELLRASLRWPSGSVQRLASVTHCARDGGAARAVRTAGSDDRRRQS